MLVLTGQVVPCVVRHTCNFAISFSFFFLFFFVVVWSLSAVAKMLKPLISLPTVSFSSSQCTRSMSNVLHVCRDVVLQRCTSTGDVSVL